METTTNHQPVPGTMVVWQLVIHRESKELDSILDYVSEHTDAWLSNQHDADDQINRTHTHISLLNCDVSKQALSKAINKRGISGSDNFGILTVHPETKTPYKELELNVYIIKGNVTLVRKKNYTDQYISECAEKWVDYKLLRDKKEHKQEKKTHDSEWDRIIAVAIKELTNPYVGLKDVRKWLMAYHWKNEGRLPHATSYKRNACSIYLKLIEAQPQLRNVGCAMEEIMEWNY